MVRKFATVIALVLLPHHQFFCLNLLLTFSMMHLMYILDCKPLLSKHENNTEVINELCNLLSIYFANSFLDQSLSLNLMDQMGWAMIVIAVFSILFNLAVMFKQSVTEIRKNYMQKKVKKYKDN